MWGVPLRRAGDANSPGGHGQARREGARALPDLLRIRDVGSRTSALTRTVRERSVDFCGTTDRVRGVVLILRQKQFA